MRPLRFTLPAVAGVVALALLPGPAAVAETTDTVNRTFSVAPGGILTVEIRHGRIDVRTGDASEVKVEIVREIDASSEQKEERLLAEEDLRLSSSGNDVTITATGRSENDGWSFWRMLTRSNTSRKHRYTITVPAEYNVDLHTSGGGIDVRDLTGTVNARTSGGGLHFAGIDGNIDARTSGGGISLEACDGPVAVRTSGGGIKARDGSGKLHVNTSGGGITVTNHQGDVVAETSGGGITADKIYGKLDAETSGGPIRASFQAAPEADCRLHTSGGGITVELPENATFDLDASTSGGGVRCDFPVAVSGEIKRNKLVGPVNGGGPTLLLRTSGGGIRVSTL